MRDFKKLKVWEKSHNLTLSVYQATSSFPRQEMYGLTAQLRDASSSIPSNIAEGCGRGGDADRARFFNIAMGSASELEYRLLLARDLSYLPRGQHQLLDGQVTEVKRMLSALIQKLKAEG